MSRDCCTTSLTAPPRGEGADTVGTSKPTEMSRPALIVRSQDAYHFSPARTKLWELTDAFHCSVIGTCLSIAELRKILAKLGLVRPDDTDHDLHSRGVSLASQNTNTSKLLHKALDDRHNLAIRQFSRAKHEADVQCLWREALRRGDIPGPYWALLTHPASSYELVRAAAGHVHMLSHLVGAANRADIRRLAELETARTELEEKVARQQAQLHAAVTTRDRSIRELQTALSAKIGQDASPATDDTVHAALHRLVGELERRLASETRRRVSLEERQAALQQEVARERRDCTAALAREAALSAELDAADAALRNEQAGIAEASAAPRLDGVSLLYVGGRPHQVVHLRALAERLGAAFHHHDGGVEEQSGLLAGLAHRADLVLFPADCVSHEAALAVKRLCRQAGKPYVPLRSAGQGSFLAALSALGGKPGCTVAAT